jgi:hypothetical protein
MKNHSVFLPLILSISLCACVFDKTEQTHEPKQVQEQPNQSKMSILGLDFSAATKTSVTRAFAAENIGFVENINAWEEVWTAGSLMEGATRIKVGFTEETSLAYLQYDFTNPSDQGRAAKLFEMASKQYGNPTNQEGLIQGDGDFVATWDMGDGLRVVLRHRASKNSNHLTYFNDKVFEVLKLEYKIAARKAVEHLQSTLDMMY